MKSILFIALLVSLPKIYIWAQEDNSKYQFSKKVFENAYQSNRYTKFTGQIEVIDSTHISYNGTTITLPKDLNENYKLIFTQGLFYPGIIIKGLAHGPINIFYFDDLPALNPNPQTKRFICWIKTDEFINPTEYYFELKNDAATETTPIKTFIMKARLSFYYRGTIVI